MIKSNKGISLITIVITIIVILILAAISIGAILGDNNPVDKAIEAKSITEQKNLETEVDLAYSSFIKQPVEKNSLDYYLNKIEKVNVELIGEETWKVTRDNAEVTVNIFGRLPSE